MVSDWEKHAKAKEDGKKGGNPRLVNPTLVPPLKLDIDIDIDKEVEVEVDSGNGLTVLGTNPDTSAVFACYQEEINITPTADEFQALRDCMALVEEYRPAHPLLVPTVKVMEAEIAELAKRPQSKRHASYLYGQLRGHMEDDYGPA